MPIVGEGIHPLTGAKFVDQDTGGGVVVRRMLTAFPTPPSHRMLARPGWVESTGITPIPRSAWPSLVFHAPRTAVPILDQGQEGKCVAASGASALMILRDRANFPFVLLSDDFLYTNINNGRDRGANGGDGAASMIADGVPPKGLVPVGVLRPAGYSAAARQAALEYKLRDDGAIPLTTFDEVVTAVALRYEVYFDVEAGEGYDTDANGVVGFLGQDTNHQQHAGEGIVLLPDGTIGVLGRNTWGTSFGMAGFCIYIEKHFKAAQSIIALKAAAPDPNGTDNPSVLA